MKSLRFQISIWLVAILTVFFLVDLIASHAMFKSADRKNRMDKYDAFLKPVIAKIETQRQTYDPNLEHILSLNKALVDLAMGDPLLKDASLFDMEGRRLLFSDTSIDFNEMKETGQLENPERYTRVSKHEAFRDAFYFPLLAEDPSTGEKSPFAVFQLRIDLKREGEAIRTAITLPSLVVLMSFLSVGLAFFWVLTRYVRAPLLRLVDFANLAANKDFTQQIPVVHRQDEIGILTNAFIKMIQNLKDMLGKIQGVSHELTDVSAEVSRHMNQLVDNSKKQANSIEGTSTFVEETNQAIKAISDHTKTLNQSATESSSSVLELSATIEEVSENVDHLYNLVGGVGNSIEGLVGAVDRIADSVTSLTSTTQETSVSMGRMDQSMSRIESTVDQTMDISNTVLDKARAGIESVQQTIGGMDKIRSSTEKVGKVIGELSRNAVAIGEILNVIDDVTEETNLLSLNAAIIAAQAGEHGKGFEVVADEVKDLAERTAASSKEISTLIKDVQKSTREATQVMRTGQRDVAGGEALAEQAGNALQEIYKSVETANERILNISGGTRDLANASRQITVAVQEIAKTLKDIEDAIGNQKRENEKILTISGKMGDTALQVKRTADDQKIGSRQITANIENIDEMVQYIDRSTSEQSQESAKVLTEVFNIRDITMENVSSLTKVHRVIRNLTGLAELLKQDVEEFKL